MFALCNVFISTRQKNTQTHKIIFCAHSFYFSYLISCLQVFDICAHTHTAQHIHIHILWQMANGRRFSDIETINNVLHVPLLTLFSLDRFGSFECVAILATFAPALLYISFGLVKLSRYDPCHFNSLYIFHCRDNAYRQRCETVCYIETHFRMVTKCTQFIVIISIIKINHTLSFP